MFSKSVLILSYFVLGIYCQANTFNCTDDANCGINIDKVIVIQDHPKGKLFSYTLTSKFKYVLPIWRVELWPIWVCPTHSILNKSNPFT